MVARARNTAYSFKKAPGTLSASKDNTTRGSRAMFRSFTWRAIWPLTRSSPSKPIQMTVTWGLPSRLMVLRWTIGPDAIKSRSSRGKLVIAFPLLRPGLQHHPEPCLPAHHAVVSLRRLIQRVRLDQRLHSGEHAKLQRVLGVDGGPAGPARHYLPGENQWKHGHRYRRRRHTDDHEPSTIPQPADRRRHCVRVRHRRQDGSGTAQLLQGLRHVFLRAVDVVLSAQPVRELGVVLTTGDGHGVEAHLRRKLHPEMPQSAQAQNRHGIRRTCPAV